MKSFRKTASMIFVLAVLLSSGDKAFSANYRFDNVYHSYGLSTQWMVVNTSGGTAGGMTRILRGEIDEPNPMQVTGNLVDRYDILRVLNGTGLDVDANRNIKAVFLTVSRNFTDMIEDEGRMSIDFFFPGDDSVTSDASIFFNNNEYIATKEPQGVQIDDDGVIEGTAHRYEFNLVKNSLGYGSAKGSIVFSQNPSDYPESNRSQADPIPFIVANVRNGSAEGIDSSAPTQRLRFRTILRNDETEGVTEGDIVATYPFEWSVVEDYVAGDLDMNKGWDLPWVFAPVTQPDSWPTDEAINFPLTVKVTNRTGVRYNVDPNNSSTQPRWWEFDLPRLRDYETAPVVPRRIYLDGMSHIAPGLAAVYRMNNNLNSPHSILMRIYNVDAPNQSHSLIVNHRTIFGSVYGTAMGESLSGNPVPYKMTAFKFLPANSNFLESVADVMKNDRGIQNLEVVMPQTSWPFSQTAMKRDFLSDGVIRSFAITQNIPSNLTSSTREAMLPVLVTFNIPSDAQTLSRRWGDMLQTWHENGSNHEISEAFKQYFRIYFSSINNPTNRPVPLDLLDQLERYGEDYEKYVKVFMDENRKVMTVSFIVMLMDGTRDGERPELRIVKDESEDKLNRFLVVRDGEANNIWELGFYIAPVDTGNGDNNQDNNNNNPNNAGESSGGGGCDLSGFGFFSVIILFFVMFFLLKFNWRKF